MCQSGKRKTRAGWFVYTRTKCFKCNVALCKPGMLYNCYEDFHSWHFPSDKNTENKEDGSKQTLRMAPQAQVTEIRQQSGHTDRHHQHGQFSSPRVNLLQNTQPDYEGQQGNLYDKSTRAAYDKQKIQCNSLRDPSLQHVPHGLHVVPNTTQRNVQYAVSASTQGDGQQLVQTFTNPGLFAENKNFRQGE